MRDFYRTERGLTLRIDTSEEGAVAVELLKDGEWTRAPQGMIGLRLSSRTRRLKPSEIRSLPD